MIPDFKNTGRTVDGNLWNCETRVTEMEVVKETPFVEIHFDKTISVNRFKLYKRIYGKFNIIYISPHI